MIGLEIAHIFQTASSWSPIQIALPIIVGVAVTLIASIFFFFYLRRHRGASGTQRRTQKPWQSAHLRGPRRFFGLIPDRLTVRSREVREPQWVIDGNEAFDLDEEVGRRPRPDSRASAHSRGTSTTSLLTKKSSQPSSRSTPFSNLASKLRSMFVRYPSGTTKGPDYKRVHIVSGSVDARFKIDGTDVPTPVARPDSHFPRHQSPPRESTVPSIIDIGPPSAENSNHARSARNNSLQTADYPPPTAIHSDFSLGTTDLMTPPLSALMHGSYEHSPDTSSVRLFIQGYDTFVLTVPCI
jgi:hypothetical protein